MSIPRRGPGAVRSRRPSSQDGRNDAVVTLEDQVVEVGRRHRTQGRQLCRRLLPIEHVERPVTGGACLQVRVVSPGAVVGADHYRVDPGGLLLGPRQSPDRVDAVAAAPYACCGHLAGAEQQVCVDLLERLASVRVEQCDGRRKEAFLVLPGDGATVSAVSQISEVAEEFRGVLQARAFHVVFLSLWQVCDAGARSWPQALGPGSPLTGAGPRSTQAAVSGWSRTHWAIWSLRAHHTSSW